MCARTGTELAASAATITIALLELIMPAFEASRMTRLNP